MDVLRRADVVRLGQDVDKTGQFAPEALERVFAMCREYAKLLDEYGVTCENVRFVATSASRDVSNRDAFFDGIRETLGIEPDVISGDEEARLAFAGATSAVDSASSPRAPQNDGTDSADHFAAADTTSSCAKSQDPPFLVVDLGGGSTELVLGVTEPEAAYSMNVGSVRITERHLHSDPPTAAEVAAARADIHAALDLAVQQSPDSGFATELCGAEGAAHTDPSGPTQSTSRVPVGRTRTLIGVAGTITSITAMCLGLTEYDRELVGGAQLPIDVVLKKCDELLAMTRAERAQIPTLQPGRVDVIGAGALVWSEVIRRVAAEVAADGEELTHVLTSEHDILDGIASSI